MKNTSLNELAYGLMEERRAYIKDTDPLAKRLVVDWIQSQRARLLEQKFNKPFHFVDDHYVQDLGSIEMSKVLSNISGIENYDYMYRTSIEIPRTIENKEGKGTFVRIGPSDRLSDHYQVIPYRQAISLGYGKFNHNTVYTFVLGDHVYLTSNGGLHFTVKYIDIRGVFQDPVIAARIKNPNWTYDDDYPINKELVDYLKNLIVSEKFNHTLFQVNDKIDDRDDNPEGNASLQEGETQSSR